MHQAARIFRGVVDALDHHVFKGDAPGVGQAGIVSAGGQQFGDGILLVERNKLVADLVRGAMQRDGKHGTHLVTGTGDFRHNPGSGKGDSALGNRQAVAMRNQLHSIAYIIEVVEWFTHTHEDYIGDEATAGGNIFSYFDKMRPFCEAITGDQHLADDFACRQVPDQCLGAGMAEGAAQGAADLAGNAQGAATCFGDVNCFNFMTPAQLVGRQSQQPFPGTVAGDLFGDDFQP